MTVENFLVIIASGKSSRFGGFPKALCMINEKTNAENTIAKAKKYFDRIYLVLNEETTKQFRRKIEGAEIISIVTGQGDADSIYKSLKQIYSLKKKAIVTICWGDAVFVDETPFAEMEKCRTRTDCFSLIVGCCFDKTPYAWFETNGEIIVHSHFAKEDGFIPEGLHDQSIFMGDLKKLLDHLGVFRAISGLTDNDLNTYDPNKPEIKLLKAFEFFNENCGLQPTCAYEISKDKVLSFNTLAELDYIKTIICSAGE